MRRAFGLDRRWVADRPDGGSEARGEDPKIRCGHLMSLPFRLWV